MASCLPGHWAGSSLHSFAPSLPVPFPNKPPHFCGRKAKCSLTNPTEWKSMIIMTLFLSVICKKYFSHYTLKTLFLCHNVPSSSLLPVIMKTSNGGVILKSPILILHASVNNGTSIHINVVGAQILQKVHHLLTCGLHTREGDTCHHNIYYHRARSEDQRDSQIKLYRIHPRRSNQDHTNTCTRFVNKHGHHWCMCYPDVTLFSRRSLKLIWSLFW